MADRVGHAVELFGDRMNYTTADVAIFSKRTAVSDGKNVFYFDKEHPIPLRAIGFQCFKVVDEKDNDNVTHGNYMYEKSFCLEEQLKGYYQTELG